MPAAKVPIQLDRPRILQFDMEAVEAMEGQLGDIPLTSTLQRLRGISMSTLVVSMWAGLRRDDPTLNIPLVRKIIKKCMNEGQSYTDLTVPIAEAIDKSGMFGALEEQPEGPEGNVTAASAT